MNNSGAKIDKRDDVDPKDGEREYGDAEFADPVNKKYPIDTEKHVRAAWSYMPPNTTPTRSRRSKTE
jgi:hypothetical protein